MRVERALGYSQTYVDAQRVVTALERAKADPTYFDSAAEILNSYVEPERTEVVNKAIALGADPDMLRALSQPGETIEITSSGPVIRNRRYPWWIVGVTSLAILLAVIFAVKKLKTARAIV